MIGRDLRSLPARAAGQRCAGPASCACPPRAATSCGWKAAAAPRCRSTATRCSRPRATRCGRRPRSASPRAGRRSTCASTTPGPAPACVSAGRGRTGAARRSRPAHLGAAAARVGVAGDRRPRARRGRARRPRSLDCAPWDVRRGVPASPRPVTAAEIAVSRPRLRPPARRHELAARPRPRAHGADGPSRRPAQRVDPRLGGTRRSWTNPARVFEAPAFHPLPDALAFSENLLLPAALVAPLQRAFGPVLAYNVALLGSLLLSGLAAQLLVRRVSGDRLAAFVAGAYFAAGPAPLDAPVAPARAGHRLPAARAPGPRPLLGAAHAAARARGRADAGAAGPVARSTSARSPPPPWRWPSLVALCRRPARRASSGASPPASCSPAAILWPVTAPYLRMRAFQGQEFTLETVAIYAAIAAVLRRGGHRGLGLALAAAARPRDDPRHALPRACRARPRRRRASPRPRAATAPSPCWPRRWPSSSRSAPRPPSTASSTSTWCSCAACARSSRFALVPDARALGARRPRPRGPPAAAGARPRSA